MRNSPINNIRNRGQMSSSPYESNVRSRSPARDHSGYSPDRINEASESEYWRTRARTLENELLAVNQQLLLQMRKNERIDDLEEKIELLLAQNTHFVEENQNLIMLLQQKNSDIEGLRRKLESEFSHSNIAEAEKRKVFDHLNIKDQEHQLQTDKLISEISRLHDQIVEMENMKQIQISQLKNKYENEAMNQIQNLKRSQYGNTQLQELNIRKLKDTIEQRDFEAENLKRQAKLESERLNGQISFLKNEIKKIEHQKEHELSLLKTEGENSKNNLLRANRKNEEELKSLHQTKLKRLSYELEQRKNEIEEMGGKLRKGGKQNQNDLNRLTAQKGKMRVELKEGDNRNRQRVAELTRFYEDQLNQERASHNQSVLNLENFYKNEINSLKEIIESKEKQIQRLLSLNIQIKDNEEKRLTDIRNNNDELKKKIEELVMHYERQIQLLKIKISSLYEADLESLRSKMQNNQSCHDRETDNLRNMLNQTRSELAKEVQDRLQLRRDYENRLNEFKIKYQREHQQLQDLLIMHEKQIENQTSKQSMTHIEHNNVMQTKSNDTKKLMNERRTLETQINNKNKEIEALNLRIQKMMGFHKRELNKLEEEIQALKQEHQTWLENQDKENNLWNEERSEFKEKIHTLNLSIQDIKAKNKTKEEELLKKLEDKGLRIAFLEGEIEEYESKVGTLHSKNKVEVQNVQKTYLETQSLMNTEKDKLNETSTKQKNLLNTEYNKRQSLLSKQIQDYKRENDLLRDNYEKSRIREEELKSEIGNLLDSVNERNKLEEHVINIGLSNNYFKNVAEIFKKTIEK